MTLDGYCDHTAVVADEELHQYYSELLEKAGVLLYGRVTCQLMEFWKDLALNPSGQKDLDDFARIMDKVPKVVFSRTLKDPDWHSARLAGSSIEETVKSLRLDSGKDIYVGSPGLIVSLTNLGLIDEYQLCVHPVIAGRGLPLFYKIAQTHVLELYQVKTLTSGVVVLNYTRKAGSHE